MDQVQLLKTYQYLSKVYNYEPFVCTEDEAHGQLYVNLDSNFDMFLFCLFCKYKYYPGLIKLEQIENFILSLPD
jgi:hypothetical protein